MINVSVTLRDAQHLCWKNFRIVNDKLDPKKGREWTPLETTKNLLEVIEAVTSAVSELEKSTSPKKKPMESLGAGLSDLLHMAFVLAQHYAIELEEVFLQRMNDYILQMI